MAAKTSSNHAIKNIADEDWKELKKNIMLHNKQFPDRKVTMRTFFKLLNTYSPLIQSLMTLDPRDSYVQQLGVNTAVNLAPLWTKNIADNLERIKKEHDIRELKDIHAGKPAIVIGAGPSLLDNASHTDHLKLISEYRHKFDGVILIADRMLEPCLKQGIGDYNCVVDGSEKIYQFFDNDTLRQYNNCPAKLHDMKGIFATSTHKKVVDAWLNGIYFFVPSIPQEILPNATSLMADFTGNTDINAGGNCGMLAWNMAAFMGCKEIAMVGMDMSYKINTPIEQTQAYGQYLRSIGKERVHEAFREGRHPFFKTPYRIDNIYQTFKTTALIWIKAFKERGTCVTYNCTEGGALHGKGIEYMYLKEFLESRCRKG